MTIGSVEPMKKLYAEFGNQVQFVEVLVRQAHPGPKEPAYHNFEEKMRDAERYRQVESIPWTLLVDDWEGTVHQAYGGLSDPSYLIDREGRISFYNMWTDPHSLFSAIETLLVQGGVGIVDGGLTRRVRLGPTLTDGWRGLERGLPQSVSDLMVAAPGSPVLLWLGYQLRPVLAPLTLRHRPLSPTARAALVVGGATAAVLGARWMLSRRDP